MSFQTCSIEFCHPRPSSTCYGLVLSGGEHYVDWILGMFLFLDLMEVPLSWAKTRGGWRVEWIGYSLDIKGWCLGISEKKLKWLRQ